MPISADLEHYDVRVGYGFSGDFLTLFGAKENLSKIAITIVGPERNFLSMKRSKFYNLWIKKHVSMLSNTSSFDGRWVSSDVKNNVSTLDIHDITRSDSRNTDDFREFADYMNIKGLYRQLDIIDSANNNMFRVKIPLPNNAPTGKYIVNVMSFDNEMEIESKIVMSFEIVHSSVNKFLHDMNKENHKTYLSILFLSSFLNVLAVRYFFIKKS